MHLLGDRIRTYGLTPTNDTIRMIDIPHWDFEWQDFYMFKNMVKVPTGSSLHADGAFNNTAANDHNPNDPAITVYPGLNTTDEMFLVYFHHLPYQQGDENYNIEEMTSLSVEEMLVNPTDPNLTVYPNPMNNQVTVDVKGSVNENRVSAAVYDLSGRKVCDLARGKKFTGSTSLKWNGENEQKAVVDNGVYIVSAVLNGERHHLKIVKR